MGNKVINAVQNTLSIPAEAGIHEYSHFSSIPFFNGMGNYNVFENLFWTSMKYNTNK